MFDELRENIKVEEGLIKELGNFLIKMESGSSEDVRLIKDIVGTIKNRARIANNAIPELLKHITLSKKFDGVKQKVRKVEVGNNGVVVKPSERAKFMEELNISKSLIRRLRRSEINREKEALGIKRIGFYPKLANKFFLKRSQKMLEKGSFRSLVLDIRKGNINVLSPTYISLMFFTSLLMFFVSIFVAVFLLFVKVSFVSPFLGPYGGSMGIRILQTWWIIVVVPVLTWILFYVYPSLEKKSVGGKINQELPFMVIQMGSVAGSGIEPLEIFRIIGLNKDYKHASKEVRKLLNQINIYGYDLVTALTNIANASPSSKLAELFSGLAITINSGGELETYFEKRADSLLLEYSLERERYTKVAETFMDIYISVVIATPMILLLLLIMISVSGVGVGNLGIGQLTFMIIALVGVVNVIFLVFLNMKQPTY